MHAFVVTIDTEANGWGQTLANSIDNVHHIRPLQDLFDRFGVRPTYLVSYEMATRDEAIRVLKPIHDDRRCEIGHHLHAWTTPPFERPSPQGVDLAWVRALQSELPDELFYAKAEALRAAITVAYGQAPTAHRAGRWAIDLRTLRWLRDAGFLVDTSMTPRVSWAHTRGVSAAYGIDTSGIPAAPFMQDLDAPFEPGRISVNGLLEVPVSSARIPQRPLARAVHAIDRLGLPGVLRVVTALSRPVPGPHRILSCRIDPTYRRSELRMLGTQALAEAGVVNLMLHSSEMMPGASPYSRTAEMHARAMKHLHAICRWAHDRGLERLTLSELARRVLAAPALSVLSAPGSASAPTPPATPAVDAWPPPRGGQPARWPTADPALPESAPQ